MKKFARVLALMLVATMLCAMLVACGAKPASDPKEAKDALEENGYKATHRSGILEEAASSAFGDGEDLLFRQIITAATGAAVCIIILAMAIHMIVGSTKEIKLLKISQTKDL